MSSFLVAALRALTATALPALMNPAAQASGWPWRGPQGAPPGQMADMQALTGFERVGIGRDDRSGGSGLGTLAPCPIW